MRNLKGAALEAAGAAGEVVGPAVPDSAVPVAGPDVRANAGGGPPQPETAIISGPCLSTPLARLSPLKVHVLARPAIPVPWPQPATSSLATIGDIGGLFFQRATNRATTSTPTMASPDLVFPGEAEHSRGSANGPFQRVRQDRESFPPLVSVTQGNNGARIFGFNRLTVATAWTPRQRTVAASPSSISGCSSSRRRLRRKEDESRFMMD
nr:hypothetical protein Iba_chr14eCG6570 [Ipomoea batatas]